MHETSFFAEPRNWVALAFIVFFALFGRKLWGTIAALLDDRAVKIRAELDEAARLRREAEAMLKDAQARRDAAVAEAKQLLEGATAEAARLALAAAAEKAAVDEVRTTAVEVATVAARQVIADGLSAEADGRLIDRAIAQLPAALAQRRVA